MGCFERAGCAPWEVGAKEPANLAVGAVTNWRSSKMPCSIVGGVVSVGLFIVSREVDENVRYYEVVRSE